MLAAAVDPADVCSTAVVVRALVEAPGAWSECSSAVMSSFPMKTLRLRASGRSPVRARVPFRLQVPGGIYHVTARGNARDDLPRPDRPRRSSSSSPRSSSASAGAACPTA